MSLFILMVKQWQFCDKKIVHSESMRNILRYRFETSWSTLICVDFHKRIFGSKKDRLKFEITWFLKCSSISCWTIKRNYSIYWVSSFWPSNLNEKCRRQQKLVHFWKVQIWYQFTLGFNTLEGVDRRRDKLKVRNRFLVV